MRQVVSAAGRDKELEDFLRLYIEPRIKPPVYKTILTRYMPRPRTRWTVYDSSNKPAPKRRTMLDV